VSAVSAGPLRIEVDVIVVVALVESMPAMQRQSLNGDIPF
jgi:hypothetical protein